MDRHCRIRGVRPKSGGYIRLLPSHREAVRDELHADLNRAADRFWNDAMIAGYVLVCWDVHGNVNAAQWNSETSPLANSMLPELAAESIRRYRVQTDIAKALDQDDDGETGA